MTEPPRAMSVPEAARRLGISRSTAWKLVWGGTMPSFRLGRRVLISEVSLSLLIAKHECIQSDTIIGQEVPAHD